MNEWDGGAPRICTLDAFVGRNCFQDSFLDWPDVLRNDEIGPSAWIAASAAMRCALRVGEYAIASGIRTTTIRLTGGHAPLTSPKDGGAPGRTCTCVVPFRRRMPGLLGHRSVWMKLVAHLSAALSVS